MKPIIRILLIVLLLVLYSCKSIALYDTSTDYDFKFDLYSQDVFSCEFEVPYCE